MIDELRNKINDLEQSIIYHQSNSNNIHNNKRSISPSRSNFYSNDKTEYKFNSQDKENTDKKHHYDHREKTQNLEIHISESENKKMKEELKSRDKTILSLENQIRELRALNKTCYELLGQLNI